MSKQCSRSPENDPCALLGLELRRVREAAGYASRDSFAVAIGFDRTVIGKAETGDRPPSPQVFPIWMDTCGVTGLEREMITRQWMVARHFAGIPVWFRPWIDLEATADSIRIWCPMLIPGLLQIEEYIRAVYAMAGVDGDEAEEKVAARLQRQAVLAGHAPVHLTVAINEPVLYSLIGTAEIMIRQLEHLLALSRRRNITIQAVRGTDCVIGMSGAFDIASGAEFPDTMRISAVEDQTTDNRDLVRQAAEVFEQIRGAAGNVEWSRMAIVEATEWWKSKLPTSAGASRATAPTAAESASRRATAPA
jgi:Domain of unknown function (DUF5753)/Helix-turn-helix domain